jgi:CDP-diacylglycerol--serine O-phosphatidyltransferase
MRRPGRRRRTQSFDAMIPNILTMFALCAGLTALRFAIEARYEPAIEALLVAAVLDAFDGRVARMLNQTSRFGAHLDTLSDFLCFGVVPAVMLYVWALDAVGLVGWALALVFTVSCALRLARFNVGAIDGDDAAPAITPERLKFFTGVPSPVGAGLVLTPLIVTFYAGGEIAALAAHPAVVGAFVVGAAALMVSQLPTFSAKQLRIPTRYRLPTMLGVALFAAAAVSATWETLTVISVVYLLSLPFGWRSYHRRAALAAAAERERDATIAGDEDDDGEAADSAAAPVTLSVVENERK